jgi:hypothetical protein
VMIATNFSHFKHDEDQMILSEMLQIRPFDFKKNIESILSLDGELVDHCKRRHSSHIVIHSIVR